MHTPKPARYISRKDCPCGAGRTSALLETPYPARSPGPVFYSASGSICVACRGCGKPRLAERVIGKRSERHECDARCMASKGPNCECSCGGLNHGASYAA